MVRPEEELHPYGACQVAAAEAHAVSSAPATTFDVDSDALWFRERWLRTTVSAHLSPADDDDVHIHQGCCSSNPPLITNPPPASPLTPDSDPRSTSNDDDDEDDDDDDDDVYDEDTNTSSSENGDMPSRDSTPEPFQTFPTEDIVLHTRIQAHLTTIEDCLLTSRSPPELSDQLSPYLPAFHFNLKVVNHGGPAAAVKLMRVARMPTALALIDQARRIGDRLRQLREESGETRQWDVGVPLPVLKERMETVEGEEAETESMFELFDTYVLPFFAMQGGGQYY